MYARLEAPRVDGVSIPSKAVPIPGTLSNLSVMSNAAITVVADGYPERAVTVKTEP